MSRRLIVFLVLLAGAAAWTHALRQRQGAAQHAADFTRVPPLFHSLIGIDESFDMRTIRQLHSDQLLARVYQNPADGTFVELLIAYFGSQENGSQIHSPQNCLPGGGYKIVERAKWTVRSASGPRTVNEFVIAKGSSRQLVQYWFVTRSGILSNEFGLKWDLVVNSLLGRPTDAAFVRLVRPVGSEGLAAARLDLRTFCTEIQPILDQAVPIAPRPTRAARAF